MNEQHGASSPSQEELRRAFALVKGHEMPSVPDIVIALNREISGNNPDVKQIATLISHDQAITGRLLKTVNSPQFGLESDVTSINQAVMMLGLDRLSTLVWSSAAATHLQVESDLAKQIWQDSLDTAATAMKIAGHVEDLQPEEAYLAGLLHDCGALLMAEINPEDYEQIWGLKSGYPLNLTRGEDRRFGTNHTVVGYLFARHWKLPQQVCEAIYLHHSGLSDQLQDSRLRALLATLMLADTLVDDKYLVQDGLSMERIQFVAHARSELLLDPELVEDLRRDTVLDIA